MLIKTLQIIRFISLHLLILLLVFITCYTSYADTVNSLITPDRNINGNKANIGTSANGLPVVNINNPNAAGVSHNHFKDYSVGNRGAIINNSQTLGTSKIGGVVEGNVNLQNPARVIINEVTGIGRSNINGPQEILGTKADYILANPNGISINGGSMINAIGQHLLRVKYC